MRWYFPGIGNFFSTFEFKLVVVPTADRLLSFLSLSAMMSHVFVILINFMRYVLNIISDIVIVVVNGIVVVVSIAFVVSEILIYIGYQRRIVIIFLIGSAFPFYIYINRLFFMLKVRNLRRPRPDQILNINVNKDTLHLVLTLLMLGWLSAEIVVRVGSAMIVVLAMIVMRGLAVRVRELACFTVAAAMRWVLSFAVVPLDVEIGVRILELARITDFSARICLILLVVLFTLCFFLAFLAYHPIVLILTGSIWASIILVDIAVVVVLG